MEARRCADRCQCVVMTGLKFRTGLKFKQTFNERSTPHPESGDHNKNAEASKQTHRMSHENVKSPENVRYKNDKLQNFGSLHCRGATIRVTKKVLQRIQATARCIDNSTASRKPWCRAVTQHPGCRRVLRAHRLDVSFSTSGWKSSPSNWSHRWFSSPRNVWPSKASACNSL